MSLAGVNKQQQLQGLNQSMYKRCKYCSKSIEKLYFLNESDYCSLTICIVFQFLDIFPNSNTFRRSNMTLIVICVVAAVIFLLIMINALIWFIFSLR